MNAAGDVPDWAIVDALAECGFCMTPAATREGAGGGVHWAIAVLKLAERIERDAIREQEQPE